MNYNLKSTNNKHSIIETFTDFEMKTFTDFEEAKKFLRHLNLGGAFDGNTPAFFMKKVSVKFVK